MAKLFLIVIGSVLSLSFLAEAFDYSREKPFVIPRRKEQTNDTCRYLPGGILAKPFAYCDSKLNVTVNLHRFSESGFPIKRLFRACSLSSPCEIGETCVRESSDQWMICYQIDDKVIYDPSVIYSAEKQRKMSAKEDMDKAQKLFSHYKWMIIFWASAGFLWMLVFDHLFVNPALKWKKENSTEQPNVDKNWFQKVDSRNLEEQKLIVDFLEWYNFKEEEDTNQ